MSVDFPEPEGPIRATNSPSSMSSDTPRRASTLVSPRSYVLLRFRSSISGMGNLARISGCIDFIGRSGRWASIIAQGLDRIEPACPSGGVVAEEDPHRRGEKQ